MCKIIGLTGPTGSGKGVVSAAWAACGAAVLHADEYARAVCEAGSPCTKALAEAFSADILNPDGTIDRKALAAKAFADPAATKLLNSITHPAICRKMEADAKALFQSGKRVVVFDSPLLFETGQDRLCDTTVAIIADASKRLARIMKRDGLTEEAAKQRMAAQPSDAFYRERADIVWENNQTPARLAATAKEWLLCL